MPTTKTLPTGYKSSPLGPIPQDWEVLDVSNITLDHKQGFYTKDEYSENGKYILIRGMDLQSPKISWENSPKVDTTNDNYNLYKVVLGDFIFARSGNIGSYGIVTESIPPSIFASYLIRFKFDQTKILNNYFGAFYESGLCSTQLKIITQGSSNININANNIKSLKLPLPPLPEQTAIANILSTVDTVIQQTQEMIRKLELRNKGLGQKLLFNGKGKKISLNDCLTYTPREVPKPSEKFFALGIRSHGRGIFHKPDFDPEKIAINTLYEIKENDLVINITFAREQAVAIASKKDEGGLVSHRFPTYTFKIDTAIPEYFKYLILQKRFKYMLGLISPGGAGRNRVLSKKDFLKLEVMIPTVKEQKEIANILDKATQQLNQYQQKLAKLQMLKKGLMQQLLTGKMRVKEFRK